MRTAKRQVIKVARPSGNSGSVYVPKEWIGQMVEIRLYDVEAVVLEALSPFLDHIKGIYLFGPGARAGSSGSDVIDVMVVSVKDLPVDEIEGMNVEVVRYGELEKYATENPADYSEMVNGAVPVMNRSLLERMKAIKPPEGSLELMLSGMPAARALVRNLEEDQDNESAAYVIISKLRDYAILSGGPGIADRSKKEGIAPEKFHRLYEVYEAKKRGEDPLYRVTGADLSALVRIMDGLGKTDKEAENTPSAPGDVLLEKVRKYTDSAGGTP